MKLPRLAGVSPVRYACVFAAFASLVMGILLIVIYWWVTSLLDRHLNEAIEGQLQVLTADLEQDGRDSMLELVREHEESYRQSPLHYLVQNAAGEVLAGDIPPTDIGEGWQDIAIPPTSPNRHRGVVLRARGEWLDEDVFVIVANDMHDLRETRAVIVRAFLIALLVTVALALGGGLAIGRALLRRVEAVNQTARAIMAGDLSQRIPVVDGRDELGGLAESLNRMLARIQELMANLQHVTSNIAHDLRTPLGRLRQRLEGVRVRPRDASDYEAVIDAAIEETDTILKTFESLLRIAQIEAGARRARFTVCDLTGVAENVVDAYGAVAEDQGKELSGGVEAGIAMQGDPELLTQMLANLVENALRHTPVDAKIIVELRRSGERVLLRVRDNGAGIPAEERARVFGRFYRLDRSRSTPGSGLGLSLVDAVVNLHGGEIMLDDNRPGLSVVIRFAAFTS